MTPRKLRLGADGKLHYPAFPGNVIPRAYLQNPASAPSLALLKLLEPYTTGIGLGSNGNLNGLDSNYHGSGTGSLNSDQWTVRGDWTINQKMHLFGRFSRFTDTLSGKRCLALRAAQASALATTAAPQRAPTTALPRAWISPLNQTLLTDFRLGYYRYNIITHKSDQACRICQRRSESLDLTWATTSPAVRRRFNIASDPAVAAPRNNAITAMASMSTAATAH